MIILYAFYKKMLKNNLIYYDRDLNRYIHWSELIPKWYKCISEKICEKCEDNLTLVDNDKCVQKDEEEKRDKGLSTGAIIGIVFGCIVFLVIFIGLIFFLVKKIIKRYDALKNPETADNIKGDNENKNKIEIGNIKNENQNSVEVYANNRMINNKKE